MPKTLIAATALSLLLTSPAWAQTPEPRTLMNCGATVYSVPNSGAAAMNPFCDFANNRLAARRSTVIVRYWCPPRPTAAGVCTHGDVGLEYLDGSPKVDQYKSEVADICAMLDDSLNRKIALDKLHKVCLDEINDNQGVKYEYGPNPDSKQKFLNALRQSTIAGCTPYGIPAKAKSPCGTAKLPDKRLPDVTLPGGTCTLPPPPSRLQHAVTPQ